MNPEVLAAYGYDAGEVRAISGGLINETFVVGEPPRAVLQKLHKIFAPEVNDDIDVVTAHLADKGMRTPRLCRTTTGEPCVRVAGETWRAITFVAGGHTFDTCATPARARAAGELVGRFHRAVEDLEHDYKFVRAGVHDTAAHIETLRGALGAHAGHALFDDVARLADEVLAAPTGELEGRPLLHAHGDLKLSNLLFDDEGEGICLVDLDTLGRLKLAHELGDACRSWCNPEGEDRPGRFDLARFAAAIEGYRQSAPKRYIAELPTIVAGLQAICFELSARFLADALHEVYFGWDSARYATRGHHNLARAESQLALARSVRKQRGDAEALI